MDPPRPGGAEEISVSGPTVESLPPLPGRGPDAEIRGLSPPANFGLALRANIIGRVLAGELNGPI
jgi:hypothetical protein